MQHPRFQPTGALAEMLAAEREDASFGGWAGEIATPAAGPPPPPPAPPFRFPRWEPPPPTAHVSEDTEVVPAKPNAKGRTPRLDAAKAMIAATTPPPARPAAPLAQPKLPWADDKEDQ